MTEAAIALTEIAEGVVEIRMQDKANKNTFSRPLGEGLIEAFNAVGNDPRYRAIVLTGYDSYFASGGTKDGLIGLSEGKGQFADTDFYSLALNCPIPVVSAMQGHGIGGGFVLGLFADFPVLCRESIYTTNFMKYGFTPGMGTTYILPKKIGIGLSHEMMLGARNYRGEELKQRGIPFPVLPRAEVMEYAYETARTLAEKPRVSLVTLKEHLVREMRAELPQFIQQELLMHEKTIHQPEVRQRIESLFGA